MGLAVRDRHAAQEIHDDPGGPLEDAVGPERVEQGSRRVVLVYPSLRRVGRKDRTGGTDREIRLGVEVLPAEHRVFPNELPLRVEDLDAMVAGVGHEDVAGGVGRQADRFDELARTASRRAPVGYALSVLVESDDALVPGVGNVEKAAGQEN